MIDSLTVICKVTMASIITDFSLTRLHLHVALKGKINRQDLEKQRSFTPQRATVPYNICIDRLSEEFIRTVAYYTRRHCIPEALSL
jgi:hypothetical protein